VTGRNLLRWPALVAARVGALAGSGAPGESAHPRELARADGPSAASSPWLTRENSILLGILAVTAAVYSRSLANAFVLDDVSMFVRNPDLRSWSFLWKGFTRDEFWYTDAGFVQAYHFRNYRPLFLAWCWIDYHLFGLNPAPWHASIVAAYLLVVWLVFKISRRLAGDSTAALIATALFAITPVHVAAIGWMAGSCYVVSTALGLGAFYLIIIPRADGAGRRWAAALVLYACALLCHESLTAFPALVASYAFLFDPNDSEAGAAVASSRSSFWMRVRRAVIWQAPFAVELFLYLIVRRLVLGFVLNNPYYYINGLTNTQAVLTVPSVLAIYLIELVMPWRVLPNHRALPVSSPLSLDFWVPLAAIVLMVTAFLVIELRDPRRRLHLFCAAWIAVTFVPMVMLHSMPHLVQDYYLYLPSLGFSLLLGDLIAGIPRQYAFARRLAFAGVSALLLVYAVSLWRAEGFWHDDIAADRGYLEGVPESVGWRWNLVYQLDKRGDLADAERELRTALREEPDFTGIYHPHSDELHRYLGELLARRGDIDGAELEIAKSLNGPPDEDEKHPSRPPLAYNHDGISLYAQGLGDAKAKRTDQAIREITKGLEMMKRVPVPDYEPLAMRYIPLAELYDSAGKQDQVDAVLKEVDSMPQGELAEGLARARIRLNRHDKQGAEEILLELSKSYPTNYEVWIQLADLQLDLKQNDDALISYQNAAGHWFADPRLHLSMARVLYTMGRNREAVDQCRLAVASWPQNWAIKNTCDWIRNNIESK
jgi:tetratricopeptide (TPR) repeat protein